MKIDENWFKFYEQMYNEEFNRLLTIGNGENGYSNHNIRSLDELNNLIEEFHNNEFFISIYNYESDENILRWSNMNFDQYEKYAQKNGIMFRFRQNTDIIQEETQTQTDIQKFMFIRRSINLGFNKEIIVESEKMYNFFKTHFDLKGTLIYNGYNECLLYYSTNELNLKNHSLTYYNLLKILQEKLELNTLVYENIEPYAQLMPLPGTQNRHSRLYVQLYYPYYTYEEIVQNGQNKFFNEEHLSDIEVSDKFHQFLKDIDNEISEHERDSRYNFEEIWTNI